MKHFALSAILLAGLTMLTTCGGGAQATGLVTAVAITPTMTSVGLNQFTNFSAQITFSNGTVNPIASLTWEVNGIPGGSNTPPNAVGTIVPTTTDIQVAVYTAPPTTPTNGTVSITAVAPQNPSDSSDTTTITSNTATVTIGSGAGLAIVPASATIPAGSNFPFSATLNSVPDPNATWSVSSANGGDFGTIDPHTGVYSAPSFPPPGALVTITVMDTVANATPASISVTIIYSDASFKGPFAFSYTGNDSGGFLAVIGSLVADGNGGITSGVEDIQSFLTGISQQVQIRGNYVVGADGRTNVTLNTGLPTASTLQFALTTSAHGRLIRFDKSAAGGGTIDQQNVSDLTNSPLVITGPYVFTVLGLDSSLKPLGIGGIFTAAPTANSGIIPQVNTVLDYNDNGTVTRADTSLSGSYSFDPMFPGTGRGTLTLTSNTTGQRQFSFYLVDNTHLYILETDRNSFIAGNIFSGLAGPGFSNLNLAAANYSFTTGGMSPTGIYAAGGIFLSDGNGNTPSGGSFDSNNNGTVTTNTTINACTYSINPITGRIDLLLNIGSCSVGPTTLEYAAYLTANNSALMLELDASAVATGMAFGQQVSPTLETGGFALNIVGQGLLNAAPASIQQVIEGEVVLTSTTVTKGTLDINNFGATFPNDPVNATGAATNPSSIVTPATNGRGTAILGASDPGVTYNLVYYLIDDNTALFFDQDKTVIAIGEIARQY